MMKYFHIALNILLCAAAATACSGKPAAAVNTTEKKPVPAVPSFNADSAYNQVARQVAFGPRVPGTEAHSRCADYLETELRRHGADTVVTQRGTATAFDGTRLPIRNITARFGTDKSRRILIAAHYDTRPWADNEADPALRNTPISGANDGGSGAAVILELARLFSQQRPEVGVDLLLVDAEDYGYSPEISSLPVTDSDRTWCLGTQYWAAHNPYTAATRPDYAIVLDMVGGQGARFYREYHSDAIARSVVDKVWAIAATTPATDRFVNGRGGAIIDDHIYIHSAGIPAIDIIEHRTDTGFPDTWHTHADDLAHIDAGTLGAVGQVMAEVIYREPSSR